MVRSIVAVLVSRGMAIESGVLMQSQANSDAALAFENAHRMDGAGGRVDKMKQNTKSMEEQYKGLLQQMVASGSMTDPDTGKPWLPSADFFRVVQAQFTALKDELGAEKTTNEGILAEAHANAVQCNTDRGTKFVKVLELQGTMQIERGEHKTCRLDEDVKINDMETKCKAFDDLEAKCDEDQDWYAQYDEADSNPLKEIVTKATACKGSVDVATEKAKTCDDAQADFQAAYCDYAKDLRQVCTAHDNCYETAKTNLEGSEASVKALEKEQKAIYRMVGKVECYLGVLMGARADAMPTQTQINECSKETINDSSLDITYDPIVKQDACMNNDVLGTDANDYATIDFRPGKGNWAAREYTGAFLLHDKLTPDSGC